MKLSVHRSCVLLSVYADGEHAILIFLPYMVIYFF